MKAISKYNCKSLVDHNIMAQLKKLKQLEQRRFTCVIPKLIIYCDDINKHATIPLINLKISQLLQSNFQEIDNYMSEIDELSNFVIPQKKFPISIQSGKLSKKEKIIKKIVYHDESYYQIAFIPPSIVVFNNIKQIAQFYFSIVDLQCLASFCFKHPIQNFIKNYIEIITLSPTRASVKVNIPEQYDVVTSQQALACSDNGYLLSHAIDTEFKIIYSPASLELYNPTTLEKQTRIIEEKELQQIIDLDFNFTL